MTMYKLYHHESYSFGISGHAGFLSSAVGGVQQPAQVYSYSAAISACASGSEWRAAVALLAGMVSKLFSGIRLVFFFVSGLRFYYQQAQKVYVFFPGFAEQPRSPPKLPQTCSPSAPP